MKINYAQKLLDPRWQKKRLEVLESAEWSCEMCGDSQSTLHVHHKQYIKGRDPWEYSRGQLTVLCRSCHGSHHDKGEDVLSLVSSFAGMDGPKSRNECAMLLAGFLGLDGFENESPAALAMLKIGKLASEMAKLRGGRTITGQEIATFFKGEMDDLAKAFSYEHHEVLEWFSRNMSTT
jgi:hypothetical protein